MYESKTLIKLFRQSKQIVRDSNGHKHKAAK